MYKEVQVKSALNRVSGRFPYQWDLNIYRGCEHKCHYCFATYSHKYLDNRNFFTDIHVKTNILEELQKKLQSKTWKKEIINIGGVTDSYQKAEEKYQLMPKILKLMIKYKNPIIISTKSDLILRDFDLIKELAELTYVNIATTITTTDKSIQEITEPGASNPENRFKILEAFKETNASTGLHMMPILPYITDSNKNIEEILRRAKECDVNYILTGALYLRGETKPRFLNFIKNKFPELEYKYKTLYNNTKAKKEYQTELYGRINNLKEKYGLSSNFAKPIVEKLKKDRQIGLDEFTKSLNIN